MNKNQTDILGTESVGKLLFQLATPAIAAQIINVLYNIVDRMYIGHMEGVGKLALTGVGVCFPLITLIAAFASLMAMGGAPKASIFLGQGDKEKAEKTLGNCFSLLVVTSISLTILFLLFAKDLLLLFGASENTIKYATDYIHIYSLGTVFVQLTLGLNPFISAQGFSKISMCTILIGACMNIILDPIFIFGLNLGVKGAALATIISQCVSMLWILKFLTGKKTTIKLKKEFLKLDTKIFLPCMALGLSPFVMQSTESLLSISFNSSLFKYGGDLAVGSMTILTSLMQFIFLPLLGLSQGAQPIISYNYGAKNSDRVKKAFKILIVSATILTFSLTSILMLSPQTFISIFTTDPELLEFTAHALRIYLAGMFIFGVQMSCQQTFLALGNAKISLFLAILRKIILLIPLIFILPNILPINKTTAVFLAEPITDSIAIIVTAIVFYFEFKKVIAEMDS